MFVLIAIDVNYVNTHNNFFEISTIKQHTNTVNKHAMYIHINASVGTANT